jgi:hypothetical protein
MNGYCANGCVALGYGADGCWDPSTPSPTNAPSTAPTDATAAADSTAPCTDTPASTAASASKIRLERATGSPVSVELLEDGVVRFTDATCLEATLCNTCGIGGSRSALADKVGAMEAQIASQIAALTARVTANEAKDLALETSISTIALTPGPAGSAGPPGPEGPAGSAPAEQGCPATKHLHGGCYVQSTGHKGLSGACWDGAGMCSYLCLFGHWIQQDNSCDPN